MRDYGFLFLALILGGIIALVIGLILMRSHAQAQYGLPYNSAYGIVINEHSPALTAVLH
ncbi:MAG TPA: hypothetical protein VNZ94_09460 [Xanthobacteraceae bacterium]|nr:hypothetical protein [Xanthobacteraceae bacterium]